jgi:predicted DNA-binding protein
MPATRTQIYLTEEQRRRIDELATERGATMAEVVRQALDAYLEVELPDPAPALEATFGAAPEASVPSRDEWQRG